MGRTRLLFAIAGALGSAVFAGRASAQTADEYVMIVLDQTGSMVVPGADHGKLLNGAPTVSTQVFDNALSAAINWVLTDKGTAGHRAYAIYTFKDDMCCGGTQTGLVKIWPNKAAGQAAVGCGNPNLDTSTIEAGTLFCLLNADASDKTGYDDVAGVLDSLRVQSTLSGTTVGGDPNNLLSTITLAPGQLKGGASFDPQFGLGPNTPLANAVCDAAEQLKLSSGIKNLTFTLETDGGENFSPSEPFHACSGTAGGLPDGTVAFTKTVNAQPNPDWGLPGGSWQGNVMRRVTRFNQSPGTYPNVQSGGLAANNAQDVNIIGAGTIKTPPDDVPVNSKWRIDVHFEICDPVMFPGSPAPCAATTPTAAFAMLSTAPAVTTGEKVRLSVSPPPPAPAKVAGASTQSLAALTATAAATSSSRTQSISSTELAFFSALGHVTPKSSFRTFVRDPAAASPVHVPKIAGDVDDSGCTDGADFRIVTQKDVYYQQAVQPNQLAIRADLNGDQWVNKLDALIVLANWGKGCRNSPGPKPVLTF
jgi:hypothetical protein